MKPPYVMSEEEANAVVNELQAAAQPTTVKRIAEAIRRGRVAGLDDEAVATHIAEFIFLGEPKSTVIEDL